MDYFTVKCVGYITYCDALIARQTEGELQAFFFSIIGSPSHIKATSAVLYGGDYCQIQQRNDSVMNLKFPIGSIRTYRNRKIGNTVNKIMITPDYFMDKVQAAAVVFGSDLATVQNRAFLSFDAATSIPLKPQWQNWLWDEILQPEKLYAFGGNDFQEAYLIKWTDDAMLEQRILDGIKQQYLE